MKLQNKTAARRQHISRVSMATCTKSQHSKHHLQCFLAGDAQKVPLPVGISLTFRLLSRRSDAPVPRGRSRRDVINSVCQAYWKMSICFPRLTQQVPFACKRLQLNYCDNKNKMKNEAKINTSPCR